MIKKQKVLLGFIVLLSVLIGMKFLLLDVVDALDQVIQNIEDLSDT